MNQNKKSSGPILTKSTQVTSELLQEVQPSFVQMLLHQNKNHENRIERILRLERNHQITIMIWLSSAISFLSFVLFFLGEIFPSWIWLISGIAFGALFLVSIWIGPQWLDDRFHLHMNGVFRWRVRRTFSRTETATPFEADYSFFVDKLVIKVESMKIEKTIWFHNVKIAYCGESFYCLFRSKTTQFWKAVVYITDNENRDEIDQLLISQGIELIGLESQNHEVSSAQ